MQFINLTDGHVRVTINNKDTVTVPPDGTVARVDGDRVVGLADPYDGTVFLVPWPVYCLVCDTRPDVHGVAG